MTDPPRRAVERQLRWLLRPFQHWLDDRDVTDIFINGPDGFFVKQRGRTTRYDVQMTYDDLVDIGINAAALMRQDIGEDVPLCSTRLPDGHRVQLVRPPAVADGMYSISIRHPAATTPTLDDLDQAGVFSGTTFAGREPSQLDRRLGELYRTRSWREFLHLAVGGGKNVVFAGEVGSGKTHDLRAFTNSIRRTARIVTVEDMPEILGLPHANVVSMFYSEGGQGTARISAEELIVAALRMGMGMDVLLMQELRNAAAFAYLRALASGHPGMTTCHAPSAEGAFDAIRLMVKQHPAGRHLADADVRAMLTSLIDVVAHCECRDGRYRITEIWYDPTTKAKADRNTAEVLAAE
ncbi:MAG TPA: P-type DNA transfer ATPase VirB11 [Acetobacteraceae bacterium]|nr:P-type DNA transfer ATPase VirB11 [Acetobacteraceae bacterium]